MDINQPGLVRSVTKRRWVRPPASVWDLPIHYDRQLSVNKA